MAILNISPSNGYYLEKKMTNFASEIRKDIRRN